ncbi:MAG: hypothetical protein RI988_1736 [Pseudomonadota bacterium]|jgi:hypothetical protein
MQMIYDSEVYAVLQFLAPATDDQPTSRPRGGYEIVDKSARREIFLEGALADRFREGVEALVRDGVRSPEAFDDYIARFSGLAQHPLALH